MDSPAQIAKRNLAMLDFLTTGAIDAGMIEMDDLRRFRRRLRRAKSDEAKAKIINQWVETIGERLQRAMRNLRHRQPPNTN